jgi:hypothetical protein
MKRIDLILLEKYSSKGSQFNCTALFITKKRSSPEG